MVCLASLAEHKADREGARSLRVLVQRGGERGDRRVAISCSADERYEAAANRRRKREDCRKMAQEARQTALKHTHKLPRRLISSRFVWPGLSRDVGLWTRSCLRCQQSKIQTHVKSSVPAIHVPSRRFSHVHIDIVGPLPSSQGYSYLLTMIDRTTRWPEAVPLSSISTESCVRAFISTWVSRFGVPSTLTSDRGAQFTSSVWAGVCRTLGKTMYQEVGWRTWYKECEENPKHSQDENYHCP